MGNCFSRILMGMAMYGTVTSGNDECFHDAGCDFGYRCEDDICQPIGHLQRRRMPDSLPSVTTPPMSEGTVQPSSTSSFTGSSTIKEELSPIKNGKYRVTGSSDSSEEVELPQTSTTPPSWGDPAASRNLELQLPGSRVAERTPTSSLGTEMAAPSSPTKATLSEISAAAAPVPVKQQVYPPRSIPSPLPRRPLLTPTPTETATASSMGTAEEMTATDASRPSEVQWGGGASSNSVQSYSDAPSTPPRVSMVKGKGPRPRSKFVSAIP